MGTVQTAETSFHRLLGESLVGESRIPEICRRFFTMGDEQLPCEADDDKLLRRLCINGFFEVGGES